MTPEELLDIEVEKKEKHSAYKHVLNVCMESGCVSSRSDAVAPWVLSGADASLCRRPMIGERWLRRHLQAATLPDVFARVIRSYREQFEAVTASGGYATARAASGRPAWEGGVDDRNT